MINRVVLVGRLTKNPELRHTQSGTSVCSFTLAVNRTFTNAQGEREADFINCIAFKKTAENINNYLSKGSLAGVDGRIKSRSYENKDGQRVYVTEVICDSVQFLESKSTNSNQSQGGIASGQYQPKTNHVAATSQNPFVNTNDSIDISDDDLPF
ncbi:single-stranded DNA-binding protein [Staphylococcus pseudintermedius]|uniref:single-stranded DNA-binding protein n=1 Tax=Staphylococcus pseudintermedius TaxID=283734 RepID=UPI0019F7A310|nr:single-stranded DNA-binding protein [Staphylococcus pseudintermedius]EGQ0365354.1 single-stranded DNA-binding protein [Staphylococcus pseudintermedius]EGQ1786700.1 single-stranded DNA-binding protein [Staphylococcus pseudintermedius]EGQ3454224.1 single-stranded DNA-binding protein [Staphylococcus pseudintermedius]EGQ3861878.1 single-stranded DNA-binding protein [Staphylococcus pseudintermedius]EIA4802537.1 single-stranded DNA-binding protein [Staphylococcus pseudintermedius]